MENLHNWLQGSVGFLYNWIAMQYNKAPLSSQEHIEILKNKGLVIDDIQKAEQYLNQIGYFRLSAYFAPFYSTKESFAPQTTFNDVLDIYIFDRKLRIILLDIVERIEIAIRTAISNTMSISTGDAHWFMDAKLFNRADMHTIFIRKVEDATYKNAPNLQSPACRHYFQTYTKPELPPSWIVAECLPMGTWSRLFQNIKSGQHKRKIANNFSFSHTDFESWLHALTIIRNLLAHHARFWNTSLSIMPRNISRYSYEGVPLSVPYTSFVILHAFIKRFIKHTTWSNRLAELLETCPLPIEKHMQFPADWCELEFWRG